MNSVVRKFLFSVEIFKSSWVRCFFLLFFFIKRYFSELVEWKIDMKYPIFLLVDIRYGVCYLWECHLFCYPLNTSDLSQIITTNSFVMNSEMWTLLYLTYLLIQHQFFFLVNIFLNIFLYFCTNFKTTFFLLILYSSYKSFFIKPLMSNVFEFVVILYCTLTFF